MLKDRRRILAIGLALLWLAVMLFYLVRHSADFLWDTRTYYFGTKAFLAGTNPYDPGIIPVPLRKYLLAYVYTPLSFYFFALWSKLPYAAAMMTFLFAKVALFVGLLWLWSRKFVNDCLEPFFYLFAVLAMTGAVQIDLRTGNISLLEQALLWSAFYFFLSGRLFLFGAGIFAAGVFKLTPLAFLGLFLVSDYRRRFAYSFGFAGVFLALALGAHFSSPGLWPSFFKSAVGVFGDPVSVSPSVFTLSNKFVVNIAALVGAGGDYSPSWASALALGLAGLIGFESRRTFRSLRKVDPAKRSRLLVFLACTTYVLVLPRFKDYSYILLIPVAYYVIRKVSFRSSYPLLFVLFVLLPRFRAVDSTRGLDTTFIYLWDLYQYWLALAVWLLLGQVIRHEAGEKTVSFLEFRAQ